MSEWDYLDVRLLLSQESRSDLNEHMVDAMEYTGESTQILFTRSPGARHDGVVTVETS